MARRYTYETSLSFGGDEPTAEMEVEVSYLCTFGRPAQTYGPAENCYPAEPDEIDDIRVEKIDGKPVAEATALEYMPGATVEAIVQALELSDDHYSAMVEAAREEAVADYEDAMERRREERHEALAQDRE